MSDAKHRIMERLRATSERRTPTNHPGPFEAWRPVVPSGPVDGFTAMFTAAGGEVVRVGDTAEATAWFDGFAGGFTLMAVGQGVPDGIAEVGPSRCPRGAEDSVPLAISSALGAVAETGSLLLGARDGRRTQLLAPVHVVVVATRDVHATLREALLHVRDDLPAAIGLHSGPSKSADIGQMMVKGVHGPGRVVALLIDATD